MHRRGAEGPQTCGVVRGSYGGPDSRFFGPRRGGQPCFLTGLCSRAHADADRRLLGFVRDRRRYVVGEDPDDDDHVAVRCRDQACVRR